MKIAFVDDLRWDYTPLTPYERPFGGTQSALCYLAEALAAGGHEVALVNNVANPGIYGGVDCVGAGRGLTGEFLNRFDAVISIATIGRQLRRLGVQCPLVFWTGHDVDQLAVKSLQDAAERSCWTAFATVSEWQARRYAAAFGIESSRLSVKRNGISPAVEQRVRTRPWFFEESRPPTLVYTSTPFRGLDVLLTAFPTICAAVPGCTLKVYSAMSMYQVPVEQDPYRVLYRLCAAIDGAEYVGPLGQRPMADALAEADILAYPSTFAETACIAAMEAMASGCLFVSTATGALPETAGRFGKLLPIPKQARDVPFNIWLANNYATMMIDEIRRAAADPGGTATMLKQQMTHFRHHHQWRAHAREWESWLAALCVAGLRGRRA